VVSLAVSTGVLSTSEQIDVERTVESQRGVIVAAHPQAAEAGALILSEGGNAIDAAVATAFALAVVEPEASGLGGGGFLLVYDAANGAYTSIDYRETAPRLSTDAIFAIGGPGMPGSWDGPDSQTACTALRTLGGSAVAVPRTVAGLLYAHDLYGRLALADVLRPAIGLAEDGFVVSDALYSAVLNVYDVLLADEAMATAFLNEYLPYEPGETARRPDLAATFRLIVADGPDAFYRGPIAADIARAVHAAGGILDAADLAAVDVHAEPPLETSYRGVRLVGPPPPAGALTVFEALTILEGFDLGAGVADEADGIHRIAETMKRAFADRAAYVGDPAFVGVPIDTLLSREWAAERRATIDLDRAIPFPEAGTMESTSTTHVSVVDADGNAVALTQSINSFFGSRVFVPEWGILLNNTMADFDPEPGRSNSIAPGKVPASSMSPLFLFDADGLRAVLGSPGGMRIASVLVEMIVQYVDHAETLESAVDAPRFHAETDTLYLESRFDPDVLSTLAARGHRIEIRSAYDLFFGGAHVIEIRSDGAERTYIGVADTRRAGQAAGL